VRKEKVMTEKNEVLYCGDATLATGACYLGGVMTLAGIGFDYVEMEAPFPERLLEKDYGLIILSDYPSGNFPAGAQDRIAQKVQKGTSLLMIGGWESFHGLIGNYHTSALAPVLPVECLQEDDRINWCQGLVPEVASQHPILKGLPWYQPPLVCGCNRVKAKKEATVVLGLRRLRIEKGKLSLDQKSLPFLVTGTYGKGRTGAVTTDFAPHWVGGLVDWGEERVTAQTPGGRKVEVGNHYVSFIQNILFYFLRRL
jgi:uncharacterized membrane protein